MDELSLSRCRLSAGPAARLIRRGMLVMIAGALIILPSGSPQWAQPPVKEPPKKKKPAPVPCDKDGSIEDPALQQEGEPPPEEPPPDDPPPDDPPPEDPPAPHVHNWDCGTHDHDGDPLEWEPIMAGMPTIREIGGWETQYARCGTVYELECEASDMDHCIPEENGEPMEPCPYANGGDRGELDDTVHIEFEGPGDFGHLCADDDGKFRAGTCEDGEGDTRPGHGISHWRAPMDPGVVEIGGNAWDEGMSDDDGDPETPPIPTYDDPDVALDPLDVTVWEFTISDGAAGFIPTLDAQVSFTAKIRPVTDHNNQSMAHRIVFGIGSSRIPGYCMNATRVRDPHQWNDTSLDDPDVKFPDPAPDGVTVSSSDENGWYRDGAITTQDVTDFTVPVICLDHGAHGVIAADTQVDGTIVSARLEGSPVTGPDQEFGARIPEDKDEDGMADPWEVDNGLDPNAKDAHKDLDNQPAGNGTPGDRLINFEEYRGFKRWQDPGDWQVGEYFQTGPWSKDLFIRSELPEGSGYAVNLPSALHRHAIDPHDWSGSGVGEGHRIINYLSAGIPGHLDQRAVWVVDAQATFPISCLGGTEFINGQGPPNTCPYLTIRCKVFTVGIRWCSPPHEQDPDTVDPPDVPARKKVIGHEIGHGINMVGDYQSGGRGPDDSIMVQGIDDWAAIPSLYDAVDIGQLQMELQGE